MLECSIAGWCRPVVAVALAALATLAPRGQAIVPPYSCRDFGYETKLKFRCSRGAKVFFAIRR